LGGWGLRSGRGLILGAAFTKPPVFFTLGFGLAPGFFLFEADAVLANKGAQLRVVVFFAVRGVVKRAFRVIFRHEAFPLSRR
jgi:hypothetical protein